MQMKSMYTIKYGQSHLHMVIYLVMMQYTSMYTHVLTMLTLITQCFNLFR